MIRFLRFADLKALGIVRSWPMLRRRIDRDGFPRGRMLGPNTRVWSEKEIDDWLSSRPTASKPPPRRKAKNATVDKDAAPI
jgi:predicted DNA-binding transcriptional regulator AlpA